MVPSRLQLSAMMRSAASMVDLRHQRVVRGDRAGDEIANAEDVERLGGLRVGGREREEAAVIGDREHRGAAQRRAGGVGEVVVELDALQDLRERRPAPGASPASR